MIIVYGAVLFFGVDWRIALVIILTSIFAILIPRMIGKSLTDARSTYQEQMAEYVTEITDLLEGFRVINQMTVGKILDKHEHVLNETAEKRYQYGKKKSMVFKNADGIEIGSKTLSDAEGKKIGDVLDETTNSSFANKNLGEVLKQQRLTFCCCNIRW